MTAAPAVWFPAVRTRTGTDTFTERLAVALDERGIRAEITWLPLRAEYAPWTVPLPKPPAWANIAHVNTWLNSRFLPRDLPIVATVHHAVHHPDARAYKGLARALYHRCWIAPIERRVLHRAARVTGVSRFVVDTTRRTLADVPMEVIYNGIDAEVFSPWPRQREAGEPFHLLYVGSWMARKGVDLLVPIMRGLGDGFELRYTGGMVAGHDKPAMPANMRDLGRLAGDGAVVAAMRDADALLFPSRSEGFGLVAAEAMACGLPVIATRGSSLTEVVEDGVTGLLCPQDEVSAFVAAARQLAVAPGRLADMRSAARQRAVTMFSEACMLDAYLGVYRAALAA